MNNNTNKRHIIKDPVYGSMDFSPAEHAFIRPFLDHPLVQRLRHVKQLSFVDLVFPGAVHTRFNHSLGCAYLCNRIYKQLFPNDDKLSESHKLILVAGLLHDIGHGPFSHAFEDIKIFKDHEIKHEDWLELFLEDIFSSTDVTIQQNIWIKAELISLFNDKKKGTPWLKATVSSQIDADRMDYLLRDSMFCGVKYGAYDIDWLISCMSLDKNNNLTITENGIGSAEQLLHARNLMHRNVYYNLKANAIAYCVIDFLDYLTVSNENNNLQNSKLLNFIAKSKSLSSTKLSKTQIMEELYNSYKDLVDFDIWIVIRELALSDEQSVCHELARRLYDRKLPITYKIKPSHIDTVKEVILEAIEKGEAQHWQLKVINKSVCFYKDNSEPVFILNNRGEKSPLHSISQTMSNVANQQDGVSFLYIDHVQSDTENIKMIITKLNRLDVFVDDNGTP